MVFFSDRVAVSDFTPSFVTSCYPDEPDAPVHIIPQIVTGLAGIVQTIMTRH